MKDINTLHEKVNEKIKKLKSPVEYTIGNIINITFSFVKKLSDIFLEHESALIEKNYTMLQLYKKNSMNYFNEMQKYQKNVEDIKNSTFIDKAIVEIMYEKKYDLTKDDNIKNFIGEMYKKNYKLNVKEDIIKEYKNNKESLSKYFVKKTAIDKTIDGAEYIYNKTKDNVKNIFNKTKDTAKYGFEYIYDKHSKKLAKDAKAVKDAITEILNSVESPNNVEELKKMKDKNFTEKNTLSRKGINEDFDLPYGIDKEKEKNRNISKLF